MLTAGAIWLSTLNLLRGTPGHQGDELTPPNGEGVGSTAHVPNLEGGHDLEDETAEHEQELLLLLHYAVLKVSGLIECMGYCTGAPPTQHTLIPTRSLQGMLQGGPLGHQGADMIDVVAPKVFGLKLLPRIQLPGPLHRQ